MKTKANNWCLGGGEVGCFKVPKHEYIIYSLLIVGDQRSEFNDQLIFCASCDGTAAGCGRGTCSPTPCKSRIHLRERRQWLAKTRRQWGCFSFDALRCLNLNCRLSAFPLSPSHVFQNLQWKRNESLGSTYLWAIADTLTYLQRELPVSIAPSMYRVIPSTAPSLLSQLIFQFGSLIRAFAIYPCLLDIITSWLFDCTYGTDRLRYTSYSPSPERMVYRKCFTIATRPRCFLSISYHHFQHPNPFPIALALTVIARVINFNGLVSCTSQS